ncbi:MAG: mechanosensitive ion channel domain-containing protein [Pseudomonadota bacterium]
MEEDQQTIVEQEVTELAEQAGSAFAFALDWMQVHVLTIESLYQLTAIFGALALAVLGRRSFQKLLSRIAAERTLGSLLQRLIRTLSAIATPVLWGVLVWVATTGLDQMGLPTGILHLLGALLRAYVIIRVATIFIPSAYWSSVFAWGTWAVAAVDAVGLLGPSIEVLRSVGFTIGDAQINLWIVVKGLMVTAGLIWLAYAASELLQRRLESVETLNSALRLLISKILRIVFIILAVVVGLTAVGVDLTAFAVFSGAIGIGVGLGLQKTISNLVASFSLLADRALKPGDVIEVETAQGATYGVVGKMTTRYVSVRSRDGTETLIPNEVLVATPVTNWSYSDRRIRRKIPVGIAYDSDVEHAMALCLEAAGSCERVLKSPKPVCLLKGFGDSSVDLELRIWIDDPEDGVSNIASEVMLAIWHRFRAHGIEIPFPQRDLNLSAPIEVRTVNTPA